MNFKETSEFQKAFKRLKKKYLSLDQDLAEFKKVLAVFPEGRGKHFALLTEKSGIKIIKARLFCRYLKGDSLRIVYAYNQPAELIEFIELYAKNEQEVENRTLIINYLEKIV
ncbi:MAG: hypothetical protein NUW07_06725 [Candidatus Saccharicenans sp.]|jgi:aminopeptidase N|nr:hypothetical protein [Candidatus Saccharicenans sp.]MDH7493453.1 hypothetical protein [Candidatus Saccharicenans sp.]